jgi:hypothetical protein
MWSFLDQSPLAQWINVSAWLYPTLLSAHGLGMAVVVGITTMVSLRILGFPRTLPLGAYRATMPYLVAAFVINAVSGVLLFVAAASELASNISFQIKLVAIVVGLVGLWRLQTGVLTPAARAEAERAAPTDAFVLPGYAKPVAVLMLLIWSVAVIVSGRLIAYLSANF